MSYYEEIHIQTKEEIEMAVWELALIIFAITYLMVNTVYLVMQVKLMAKMEGLMTKSCKVCEKMIDKSDKYLDDLFDEE